MSSVAGVVYGRSHRKVRAALAPDVEAGKAWCCERICLYRSRWIKPGTPWDLAHDRRFPGAYLGPAHAKCNRAEGARFGNGRKAAKGTRPRRAWRL